MPRGLAAWSGPACLGAPAAPRVHLPQGIWSLLGFDSPICTTAELCADAQHRQLQNVALALQKLQTEKNRPEKGANGGCQCSTPPARLAWRWSLLIPDVFPSRGVGPAGSPPLHPVCWAGGCPCPALCSDPGTAPRRARRNSTFEERGHHCRPWLFPSRSLSYFC